MLGLLGLLILGLIIAVALASWHIAHLIGHPPRRTDAWAVARGVASDPGELDAPLAFRPFSLSLELKGRVRQYPAWEVEGEDPEGPVVIMTPGWGSSRIGMLIRMGPFAAHASKIIAWDPPGHGEAPGRWTMGVHEPAMLLAIADGMRAAFGTRCVLFGSSAGGGVSVVAAAMDAARAEDERSVCGVIAEAPYRFAPDPARNVIRTSGFPWAINGPIAFAWMGVTEGVGVRWRGFDRAAHASRVDVPLLVIHGDADETCEVDDGREIAARAGGEIVVVEGGGHNDLWTNGAFRGVCAGAVEGFLRAGRMGNG